VESFFYPEPDLGMVRCRPTYGENEMNRPRWRFWNQPIRAERAEIQRARADGDTDRYMEGQRWAQMIEAETERRRRREHKPARKFAP
jgi:hypothetical protein